MLNACGEDDQEQPNDQVGLLSEVTPQALTDQINSGVDIKVLQPAVRGQQTQINSPPPSGPLYYPGETIRRIPTAQKIMVFTFDDGPDKVHERALHNVLKVRGYEGKAAWFFVGVNAQTNPDVVREMHGYGYDICNHTRTHADYSVSGEAAEIAPTQDILHSITGEYPIFFRGAGGTMGAAITQKLVQLNMAYIWTTGDEQDYISPRVNPATMNGLLGRYLEPGYISLRHSGGTHDNTVNAMHDALTLVENAGYTIMSLREALQLRQDGITANMRPNTLTVANDQAAMLVDSGPVGPLSYDLAADTAKANAG